jgi:hypothetical protein
VGSTTPFVWREALEAFQLLFILWRAIVPFTLTKGLREGLFGWASTRFIFGAGSAKKVTSFLFLHSSPAGSCLLDSFPGSARPFPDVKVSAPLARGP